MTQDIFKKMMALFFQSFPNKVIDLNLCWEMLKDISDNQFVSSVKKIMATKEEICQSTNIIALIRKNAIRHDLPLSAEAWAEVLSSVSRFGCYDYHRVEFSNSAIKRAVDGIGWKSICMSENIGIERAHFFKIYDQIIQREEKETLLSEGLIEDPEMRSTISFLANKLSFGDDV